MWFRLQGISLTVCALVVPRVALRPDRVREQAVAPADPLTLAIGLSGALDDAVAACLGVLEDRHDVRDLLLNDPADNTRTSKWEAA